MGSSVAGTWSCFAHRLEFGAGNYGLRLGKCLGVLIDTKPVFNRIANMRLGIDGTAQMAVQVGAFRHALEEVAKRERLSADALQRLHGTLRGGSLHILRAAAASVNGVRRIVPHAAV